MKRTKKKQYRSIPKGSYRRALSGGRPYYFFAAALSLWLPKSYSAVLVDLDATTLPTGALTNWANGGTLGGQFTAPAGGVPSVAMNQFVKGVTFNGTAHYYTGPDASAVSGAAPRTVEAWILNPAIADEETIFSWGRRGGGDGSNASFNHGANPTFGAVGHWGVGPDIGWNGNIAANRWTYVVYTYDGTTTRVYMDGALANSEDMVLDTWAIDNSEAGNPLPFRIAAQNEPNGTATTGLRGSMTIAKIRVHDEAISDATILANFNAQAIAFGLGDQDSDGLPTFYENQYPGFLNPTDPADAARDQDTDGLTNLQEYTAKTAPDRADTDGDTINDGVELNRQAGGVAAPTDPLRADTDLDGLRDNVESDTGTFQSLTNTGTDPLDADSDDDTFSDLQEAISGSEPNVASSTPPATRGAVVSLDAANLAVGVVNTWTNAGTLGGNFTGSGAPRAGLVQGVNAVTFNSTGTGQFYTGPAAPAFLAGNGSHTVEAWILNPTAADEETVFTWGRRGGPAGSNASFNHGLNATWGAVGHWDAPDIGWGAPENVKQGQWTYVVYTYDGPSLTTTVYSDGAVANTETLAAALNVHATDNQGRPLPFRVASQNEASGAATGTLRGSMSIAELRVFDRVLDESAITANFAAGQDKYGLIDYDNDQLPTWYERQYGFPERTANGTEDPDSDGLTNVQEFGAGTNPTIADTDGDGLNDSAEVNRAPATNPLLADSDQDGLSDRVETGDGSFNGPNDTGSDPLVVDTDGDTFSDGQEVFNGSNPTTLNSTPTFSPSRPLIDLNPAALANGLVQSWTNSGSMGGFFTAPTDLGATAETVSGAKGVTFAGTNYYNGPVTPEFITGNASRTVDAWVFNPAVAGEESLISWGRRGGPDGSNASYIHGTDATFGAMGQWGAGPDVGWGTLPPLAGQWTHVAYVYDGPTLTANVYRDGALANTETFGAALAIHPTNSVGGPLLFKLGAQNNADGGPGGGFASFSMGRVRVYDFALSGTDIANIYNAEKAAYPLLPPGTDITAVSLDQATRAITITWTPPAGRTVAVEASTSLTNNWNAIATGLTTGQFSEPTTGANYKFYRLRVE
ncbi:MAG TPA: LamG-like jellyroll fold domain-containing protein [Verrucomicrobiae bacterium]